MALGGTDLNLIVVLKVLLEEEHVSRAAARLGMSQPAMSSALAKLRRRFDDDLLARVGRGYELTPLARALLPEAREAVRLLARGMRVEDTFDPASSERVFHLLMSDYAAAVVHEPLLRRLAVAAPRVSLEIHPMPGDAYSERVLAAHDVMVAPLGFGFPGMAREMWRDRMVCVVDRDNPWLVDDALTLDALAAMPHAVASLGPGVMTPVDRVMGELNIARHIQVQVAGWLPLLFVIEGSAMVACVPERLARLHVGDGSGRLMQVEPPFGTVLLVEGYLVEAGRSEEPALRWLTSQLDLVAADLGGGTPP